MGSPGLGVSLLLALSAQGQDGDASRQNRFRLSWELGPGTESCPLADSISADVVRRLGRDPFSPNADRSLETTIDRLDGRWTAKIVARDKSGAVLGWRALDSLAAGCDALADAVALALAIAIDPEAAFSTPAPSNGAVAAPSTPRPKSPPTPMMPAAPPSQVLARPTLEPPLPPATASWYHAPGVTLRVAAVAGVLPGLAPAVALSVDGPAPRRWRLVGGALFFPEAATAAGEAGFGLTAGWIGGCVGVTGSSRASLSACGAALGGVIHAVVHQGSAIEPIAPGDRGWAALSAGGDLTLRLAGPAFLQLGADVLAPLIRHRFVIEGDAQPIHQAGRLGWGAHGGVGVKFR